jgi:hypothetical protein
LQRAIATKTGTDGARFLLTSWIIVWSWSGGDSLRAKNAANTAATEI